MRKSPARKPAKRRAPSSPAQHAAHRKGAGKVPVGTRRLSEKEALERYGVKSKEHYHLFSPLPSKSLQRKLIKTLDERKRKGGA